MNHTEYIRDEKLTEKKAFLKKAAGRFFTGELIGMRLARVLAKQYHSQNKLTTTLSVIDPFSGDGRLVEWLLRAWHDLNFPPQIWQIELWDLDGSDFDIARKNLIDAAGTETKINIKFKRTDSFSEAYLNNQKFDIVLTNPPWELLKPDKRELANLPESVKNNYISKMRDYDGWISYHYPLSQPKRKFAGWGTNLSRVGLEVCLKLTRDNGIFAGVFPASMMADDQSVCLRKQLIQKNSIHDLAYYSAETKQFGKADVSSITLVATKSGQRSPSIPLYTQGVGQPNQQDTISMDKNNLERTGYALPVSFGASAMQLLTKLASTFNTWQDIEDHSSSYFWAGRELDETRSSQWLCDSSEGRPLFVKGRMIDRYSLRENPSQWVARPNWRPSPSIDHLRIAWRDISRPNQKRRLIATLIPPGWAAGNSLGVAYFSDDNEIALKAMLGIMNSTTFEFQLRAYLATSHVSLSNLRKTRVPPLSVIRKEKKLAHLVNKALAGKIKHEILIDVYVAKIIYGLTKKEYTSVLNLYKKFTAEEHSLYLDAFHDLNVTSG